jgi:hypothetical protein
MQDRDSDIPPSHRVSLENRGSLRLYTIRGKLWHFSIDATIGSGVAATSSAQANTVANLISMLLNRACDSSTTHQARCPFIPPRTVKVVVRCIRSSYELSGLPIQRRKWSSWVAESKIHQGKRRAEDLGSQIHLPRAGHRIPYDTGQPSSGI